MPTLDPLFLIGYTIVIYIGFCFLFLEILLLSVFCMYEVETIFFVFLHFYNIKINNNVLK
jgi:hypothetical protein